MTTRSNAPRLWTRTVALAIAGLLLAACSVEGLVGRALSQIEGVEGVDIDVSEEGGSFTITSDEGEVFGIEVDDQGRSTLRTDEGTVTTTVDGEVPAEVTAAVDLPTGFTPQAVSETTTDDGRALLVQGEIRGSYGDILDEVEASLERRWAVVQRQEFNPGQMGTVMGHDEDEEVGVTVNLIIEPDSDEGLLQIMVINPSS